MKKNYLTELFIFALTLLSINLFSQNKQIIVGKEYTDKNKVTLITEKQNSTTFKFEVNELNLIEINTEYGKMYKMESDKAPLMLEAGKPELIYLPTAIIIPETGSTELQFIYGNYKDIENVDIAPSKGNLSRNVNPATVPYQKGEVYEIDAFFPEIQAVAHQPFIMRDVRGQSIFVYPVQYNPVTKTLRIYSEITVTAIFNNTKGVNELSNQKHNKTIDPQFNAMYNNLFINYNTAKDINYPIGEEGELLIICHPAFMDVMKPFVDWKRTIGRETTIVSTKTSGTTVADIKSYISGYYNNPANNLAYVLLVGDFAQVPARVYNREFPGIEPTVLTDNYYGQLEGNDRYMEVLISRMSAETVEHVQTQVQRSIWYERDINTSDTWIPTAIGISAHEGNGGHNDEDDYVHINLIRNRLLAYGYDPVYQEYGRDCIVPETSAAQISQRFNDGVSMANYCNHGIQTAWTLNMKIGVQYTTAEVSALTNTGKLPFIFSQACLTGRFDYSEPCLAEAWMRGVYNNKPVGAVATIMATTNLSWAPPMTAQDEFVNICLDLPSPYPSYPQPGTKITFAGAAINSTHKMLLRHGTETNLLEVFDSWTVFGDPTLMMRTKIPKEIELSNLPTLIIEESTSLIVECNDAEGALAVLSFIDENEEVIIMGKAIIEDGIAEIFINEPVTSPTELNLTITGKNLVTYQGTITPKAGNYPYLYLQSYSLTNDPVFGQQTGINFELKNLSSAPYDAQNVVIRVETESQYVTVPELPFEINDINAESIYISENELFVTIAENVPNNELIIINLLISCKYEGEDYECVRTVKFQTSAPTLYISEIYIESPYGTRLPQFDKNSVNNLVLVFDNNGKADLENLNVAISIPSNYMNISENFKFLEIIEKGNNAIVKFPINTGNPVETIPVSIVIRASSGAYKTENIYTNSIGSAINYHITNETIPTTYGNFYDSGGITAPYSANESLKITFLPKNEGKKLKVSFSSFNVEEKNDNLFVYNGTQALGSLLLATLTGSELPQDIEATNEQGALTFQFKSNAEIQYAGWAAIVYEAEKYYNLSFVITDEVNNPVTDAIITFDGYVLAKNQFNVSSIANGEYEISVKKAGYSTHKEKVKIENEDKELTVKLNNSSIENNSLSDFYTYPNPFNDIIYLRGNSSLINKVYINNILGQRVKEIILNGKSSFSTENLPKGVYFITFERIDGKIETVKMIKK